MEIVNKCFAFSILHDKLLLLTNEYIFRKHELRMNRFFIINQDTNKKSWNMALNLYSTCVGVVQCVLVYSMCVGVVCPVVCVVQYVCLCCAVCVCVVCLFLSCVCVCWCGMSNVFLCLCRVLVDSMCGCGMSVFVICCVLMSYVCVSYVCYCRMPCVSCSLVCWGWKA